MNEVAASLEGAVRFVNPSPSLNARAVLRDGGFADNVIKETSVQAARERKAALLAALDSNLAVAAE